MKNTGESIEDCIDKYQTNKAVTTPGTKGVLIEVMDFLKRNVTIQAPPYQLKNSLIGSSKIIISS
ncbi:hypothetical protein HQ584_10530 [Patescibacteria group bacterium]|nr:hypothetical protein [Patescibacteria group bacterium]